MGGKRVIRKVIERTWKKTAAVILVLALAAGAYGCGKSAEPAAKEETAVEESASAQSTVKEPINPEEVKSEEIVKEDAAKEETVKDDTVKEETVPQETDQVQEQASAASTQEEKKEVIEKPEVSDANTEAAKEKEEKKKEEKKEEKPSTQDLNEVLDGVMTFDGMELEFPVELSGMKLGKWTLTYELEGDPASKTLAYQETVLAKMTSPDFTDDDIIVKAEFGNYTGSEAALTDLPMTGIYITKGKGKDGAEPKLPSLQLPCGFTWGTSAEEVKAQLGEASFSGSFDYDFDYMYENGEYLFEVGGMNDTGIEYIVYSVE